MSLAEPQRSTINKAHALISDGRAGRLVSMPDSEPKVITFSRRKKASRISQHRPL